MMIASRTITIEIHGNGSWACVGKPLTDGLEYYCEVYL
jgi:hypothetical protein